MSSQASSLRVSRCLREHGYGALSADEVCGALPSTALLELESLRHSFSELVQDTFMNDGGTYRFRRYSRFRLEDMTLSPLAGHSIQQTREENPLNGGLLRTFAPLAESTHAHPLLRALILHDAEVASCCEGSVFEGPVQVGVHQVRIVAVGEQAGMPTPEGVHLDGESFTFQHFMGRDGVSGGEFFAYDQNKAPVFSWLQEACLDSVVFRGTTWHSATPITCNPGVPKGHRDIFLVDFDPLEGEP